MPTERRAAPSRAAIPSGDRPWYATAEGHHLSQPLRRKKMNGAATDASISANANG